MAQIIEFVPSTTTNQQFQVILDGATYLCQLSWNVYGQRWYIAILDLNNTLIVKRALIGSPLDYDISLTSGYFTTSMVFRQPSQTFEIA